MPTLKAECELEFCARIWWHSLGRTSPFPLPPTLTLSMNGTASGALLGSSSLQTQAVSHIPTACNPLSHKQPLFGHFQDLGNIVHIRSVVPKSRRRHLSPGSRHSKIQIRNLKSWVSGLWFRREGVGSRWAHPMCTVDYTPCRGQGGIQKTGSSYPALKAVMRREWMK